MPWRRPRGTIFRACGTQSGRSTSAQVPLGIAGQRAGSDHQHGCEDHLSLRCHRDLASADDTTRARLATMARPGIPSLTDFARFTECPVRLAHGVGCQGLVSGARVIGSGLARDEGVTAVPSRPGSPVRRGCWPGTATSPRGSTTQASGASPAGRRARDVLCCCPA